MRRAALLVLAVAGALAPRAAGEPLDPKTRDDLIGKVRRYFDPAEDSWKGRKDLKGAVEALARSGTDLLKDVDRFQELLYPGRHFDVDFSDRKWQTDHDITAYDVDGPFTSLRSERLRFTFALPRDYPRPWSLAKAARRPPPFPLIFSLHEPADDDGKPQTHAGLRCLRRRWPERDFAPIYAHWLMLAPATKGGRFIAEDGTVRAEATTEVYSQFWKRFHVDFDHVVLDGADAAITMAAAYPVFFAGAVFRGGTIDPALVPNYASVPVFVFDEAMERALRDAGHPSVTRGGTLELIAWLQNLPKHETPTKFSWLSRTTDQVLAHWINLTADPKAKDRTLSVDVDRQENRIRLETRGWPLLTLFLNDHVVDLDREVTVVLNGEEVRKEKFARNFDVLLEEEPLRLRVSNYLGWLYPVQVKIPAEEPPAERVASPSPEPPAQPVPPQKPPNDEADILALLDGVPENVKDPESATGRFRDTWWRPVSRAGPTSQLEGLPRALVLIANDRLAREREGMGGLAGGGPLAGLRDDPTFGPRVVWFEHQVRDPAYAGPTDDRSSPEARRADEVSARNAHLALAVVLAFLLLAALAAVLARPRSAKPA